MCARAFALPHEASLAEAASALAGSEAAAPAEDGRRRAADRKPEVPRVRKAAPEAPPCPQECPPRKPEVPRVTRAALGAPQESADRRAAEEPVTKAPPACEAVCERPIIKDMCMYIYIYIYI